MKNTSLIKGIGFSAVFALSAFFTACEKDVPMSPGNIDHKISIEDPSNGELIPNQYIVVMKHSSAINMRLSEGITFQQRNDVVAAEVQKLLSENGIEGKELINTFNSAITGFSAQLTLSEKDALTQDSRVEFIEQDRMVVLAPPPGKGKPDNGGGDGGGDTIPPAAQKTPWGITEVGGANDGSGKRVWIIDTGVDLDHPDLNVNSSLSRTFFTKGKDSKSADDGNGHGTHVAGTIAAIDNDVNVVGVAAGAEVVAVKVLDSRGSGSYSTVIAGIDYVAANASAGDVANMSLGGPTSQALDDAVTAAANVGVLFALAAGNDAEDANNSSPARVNHTNVYTVSAYDVNGDFAYFSNYGNPPVDFAAPGVEVLSLWKDGGTNTISGTSMASPHLAGVLVVTGGVPLGSGTVNGDPDGTPDTKVHL